MSPALRASNKSNLINFLKPFIKHFFPRPAFWSGQLSGKYWVSPISALQLDLFLSSDRTLLVWVRYLDYQPNNIDITKEVWNFIFRHVCVGTNPALMPTFNVGEEVHARWANTGKFYDCKVLAVNANGHYQLEYSDGDVAHVHGSLCRSKKQGTSAFITGDECYAPQQGGTPVKCKVHAVNDEKNISLVFPDGMVARVEYDKCSRWPPNQSEINHFVSECATGKLKEAKSAYAKDKSILNERSFTFLNV